MFSTSFERSFFLSVKAPKPKAFKRLKLCNLSSKKPYFNRAYVVIGRYSSSKTVPYDSFKSLGLWSPNRYEIDLLNEVLNIDFGQGAAKISEVKVGV